MSKINDTINAMMTYFKGDVKRIQHFLKVYAIARTIGINEKLPEDVQYLLEVAAITHDIGIKLSEEKFGSSAGAYQEQEGPAEAEKLLTEIGYEEDFIDKVCYLIAHHHTYKGIDNAPYRILVEADFLVNIYEEHISMELAKNVKEKIFRTESGIKMFEEMYDI
ncbi:MAG: HD domain-containing protein [Oscillospiraceae bacterium]|nr:HD domain-containing protein [Oscillospiraceae bacterium]